MPLITDAFLRSTVSSFGLIGCAARSFENTSTAEWRHDWIPYGPESSNACHSEPSFVADLCFWLIGRMDTLESLVGVTVLINAQKPMPTSQSDKMRSTRRSHY